MGEEEAYEWFKSARWPATGGEPTCPKCGCTDANDRPGRRFRCKDCQAEFSVTSGTILASRKLSFQTLLRAIVLSVQSVKGKAACQLKRELGVDYKTAFVLLHKFREAIAILRRALRLDGTVEIDGMYVGGPADVAWREDKRRTDFREQAKAVLAAALAHPISRDMAGYWQRTRKRYTALVAWNPLAGLRVATPA